MSIYDLLPLSTGQIRVLTILPGSHDDPVSCLLKTVDLEHRDTKLDYALSYTWGAPATYGHYKNMTNEMTRSIVCNGQEASVTDNLLHFLTRARQTSWLVNKILWIDAICINQHDLVERAHQVRLMGELYSSATEVLVWLGDEDEHTAEAFALLENLVKLDSSLRSQLRPELLDNNKGGFKEFLQIESWMSLAMLFLRNFFTRAWIMQEVILAKDILVQCGSHSISWNSLVELSRYFAQTGWGRYLDKLVSAAGHGSHCYSHIPAMLDASRGDRPQLFWADILLYTLIRARHFNASDQRDKVYSLLGLVEEHIGDKPLLEPRYEGQNTATTYTKAAAQIIEASEDMHLLSCVEGELFQDTSLGKMPSWVPDWSCGKSTGLLVTGYKRYSAAGALTQRPQVDYSEWTLALRGMRLDIISMVGEAKHEVLDGNPFPRWLDILESLPEQYCRMFNKTSSEDRLDAFWRTLIRNTSGSPPEIVARDSALAEMFHTWFRERVAGWGQLRADQLLGSKRAPVPLSMGDENLFATTFTYARHLRLFRTANGLLGLGSECVKDGDQVWILPGSRVPLLLRPVEQGVNGERFRLVGGAYVHGVMNGEALDLDSGGQSNTPLKTIVLE